MGDLLSAIPIFSGLQPEDREELQALLRVRKFEAQQPIFWIGERGDEFYLVHSGRVEVSAPDDSGKNVVLAVLKNGDFFGEISLLDGGPRTATVRAVSSVSLLSLVREDFLKFLRKHPDASIHMLGILGHRQRETLDKMRGIRNVNEAVRARQTPLEVLSEKVASFGASTGFLIANLVFFMIWMIINIYRAHRMNKDIAFFDEPPTFFMLGFMITLEAIILSMFVLNSQKRSAERDAINADLDYQVNVKAHMEIMQLHQKMDRLQLLIVSPRPDPPSVRSPGNTLDAPVGDPEVA